MESFEIHHDLLIKKPSALVFKAVTEPTHLVNWWPLKCSGKPEKGEVYNFNFTDDYDWYGEVIHVEENRTFHVKMVKSDDNWNPTSFGFDLEENSNATLVKFWHVGWPACNDEFRQSSYCWAILLNSLKKYLETGVIVPFNLRE